MMISFKGYNIGIIDHLAFHFHIKQTGKVVWLVSVMLELHFDVDVSFSIISVQNRTVSHSQKLLIQLSLKNKWTHEFFRYLAEDRNHEWFVRMCMYCANFKKSTFLILWKRWWRDDTLFVRPVMETSDSMERSLFWFLRSKTWIVTIPIGSLMLKHLKVYNRLFHRTLLCLRRIQSVKERGEEKNEVNSAFVFNKG